MVVTSSTGLLTASSGTLKLFWYVKQKTVPETYLKAMDEQSQHSE